MSSVLEPRPQFGGALEHPVLDVDLVLLIAREGEIESRQQAVAAIADQLLLEQKVASAPLAPKEEPIAAARSNRSPFLQKGTKWRDAGAGPDHDDRRIGRRGQPKTGRAVDADRYPLIDAEPIGEECRGDAKTAAGALLITHGGDRQVDLAGNVLW